MEIIQSAMPKHLLTARLLIFGMRDNHTFKRYLCDTVEEIVVAYARDVEDREIDSLCPAIVSILPGKDSRIGEMIHDTRPKTLSRYVETFSASPGAKELLLWSTYEERVARAKEAVRDSLPLWNERFIKSLEKHRLGLSLNVFQDSLLYRNGVPLPAPLPKKDEAVTWAPGSFIVAIK